MDTLEILLIERILGSKMAYEGILLVNLVDKIKNYYKTGQVA